MMYGEEQVSFRKWCGEIGNNVFKLFPYPAKFIPHIPYYAFMDFAGYMKEIGGFPLFDNSITAIDPFAGCGTTGLVSGALGVGKCELWDINPLLEEYINIVKYAERFDSFVNILVKDMIEWSEDPFYPTWENIEYWHPKEFLSLLTRAWGFMRWLKRKNEYFYYTALLPLLKTTEYFSYSDPQTPKFNKTVKSQKKIEILLIEDWKKVFKEMMIKGIKDIVTNLKGYPTYWARDIHTRILNSLEFPNVDVDVLITSPPYLQAREYIRKSKLFLYWLGYSDQEILVMRKREIPYFRPIDIEIRSSYYEDFSSTIYGEFIPKKTHLVCLYESYFHSILGILDSIGKHVKSRMYILVGNANLGGFPVPIDKIVAEHLVNSGWTHEKTLVDRIAYHTWRSLRNPSTGRSTDYISEERLLILKK